MEINPLANVRAISDGIQKNLDRVLSTTSYTRLEIYRYALDEIEKSPVIGAGYDQLSTSGISSADRLIPRTVHNVFLQILYVGGLLPFITWVGIYVYAATQVIKSVFLRRASTALSIGLAILVLAVVIMDQFQDAIYQREKWLVIALSRDRLESGRLSPAK
jgi:O-antigen ligase